MAFATPSEPGLLADEARIGIARLGDVTWKHFSKQLNLSDLHAAAVAIESESEELSNDSSCKRSGWQS